MNSMQVIVPYKYNNLWVFDDSMKGLERELFVGGTDEIIDVITHDIPHAEDGFYMIFSDTEFPNYHYKFELTGALGSGNTYAHETLGEGWLCPALLKYFAAPPANLYVQVKGK